MAAAEQLQRTQPTIQAQTRWWSPVKSMPRDLPPYAVRWQVARVNAQGRCEVRAFFGKHRVTADGKERIIELKPAEPTRQISFTQQ